MTTQAFNLSQFANFLNSSGQVSAAGIQSGVILESGTVSLYYQASAPTGWTQLTSLNDYALRIASSGGGTTGGSIAFSTVFSSTSPTVTVGATTLSSTQIPTHSHSYSVSNVDNKQATWVPCNFSGFSYSNSGLSSATTGSFGGGDSHTHSATSTLNLNVRYVNIILCSKN